MPDNNIGTNNRFSYTVSRSAHTGGDEILLSNRQTTALRNAITETGFNLTDSPQAFNPVYRTPTQKNMSEEDKFIDTIRNAIIHEQQVNDADLRRYKLLVSKNRHIDHDERRMLHRPKSDGNKCMSSCPIDDLVPLV